MDTVSLSSFVVVERSETQDQYDQENSGFQALISVVVIVSRHNPLFRLFTGT